MTKALETARIPKKGDRFEFGSADKPVRCVATRVSRSTRSERWPSGWVDLRLTDSTGYQWSKRQPLPLSPNFRPVG